MMKDIPFYQRELDDVRLRRKRIWERHQAGETYVAIAKEMRITAGRVRILSELWRLHLTSIAKYKASL